MKKIKIFAAAISILGIFSSCEEILNDPSSAEVAESIEGWWKVDENSQIFKTTYQTYRSYISVSESDETLIYIDNFYGLGNSTYATARVNGYSISLDPNQVLSGGYTLVSGNGSVNKNLREITWNYSLNDGSGEIDNIEATYTFDY
jgi:hypothetical protein